MNNERMQLTYLDVFNNLNAKNIYASGVNTNQLDLNSIDVLSISGVDVSIISGNVTLTNRPTVNGLGVVLSGEINPIIVNTGSLLNDKINSLSGYVNSQDIIFSGQTASTGSRLDNKINSLSGYVNYQDTIFSGQTFNTGSRLDNKINALSGYVTGITGTFGTLPANLALTGSVLNDKINSLSGYLNSQDNIFSGQTFNTGSRLDTKINSLSGYLNSLSSNIVFTTGNQAISGNKTFRDTLSVSSISGISGSTSININAIDNAQEIFGGNYLGGGINLTAGSGNFIGGSINLFAGSSVTTPYNGNIGIFGNVGINNNNESTRSIAIYKTGALATALNVWIQQSSVDVNNLLTVSGNPVLTGLSTLYATSSNLVLSGSTLDNKINSLSGASVLTFGNQNIFGTKSFISNTFFDKDITVTGNIRATGTAYFNDNLNVVNTLNVSGNLNIGGNLTASNVVLTRGRQTISGVKTLANNLSLNAYTGNGYDNTNLDYRLNIGGDTNENIGILIDAYGTNPAQILMRRARGIPTGLSGVLKDDVLFNLQARGYVSGLNAYSSNSRAAIRLLAAEDWVARDGYTGQGTYVSFRTTNVGSGLSMEKVIINTSGLNVLNGNIYISGNPVLTGSLGLYATSDNLLLTGSTLDNKINSLSGYVSGISLGGLLPNSIVYNTGNQIISGNKTFINSGVFSLSGVIPLSLPNNPLSVVGSGNSYIQLNIQNRATGTTATADLVITANNGTDSANYINLGINNSGYNDPTFSNGSAYDGYLFINGGSLDIGTQSPNTTIEFHVGGTTADKSIAKINSSGFNIVNNLQVQGTGIFNALDLSNISEFNFSGTNINLINGNVNISGGTLYISGNPVLTGSVQLGSYATSANLASTGSILDNKINSLSGYVDSKSITLPITIVYTTGDQIISGNKTFLNSVAVSGTGNFNAIKVSSIDKLFLSGIDIAITGNSSVNVYNAIYISGNPVLTGVIPSTQTLTNVVYTTGDQIVSGNKTFINNINISGTGNFNAVKVSSIDKLFLSGVDVVITGNSSINVYNAIYISGNPVLTGSTQLGSYATLANLVLTGSILDNKINSLSGYVTGITGTFGTLPANLYSTGSTLDAKINSLSGFLNNNVVYITGSQSIYGNKTFFDSGIFSSLGVPAVSLLNNPLSVVGSGNSYVQLNIQNRATGTNATADLVITANNGTDNTNYINLGINNSGYNDPAFSNGSGLDGYLFVNGGSLDIGTQTPNTNLEFHIGGTTANRAIARIDASGMNMVSGTYRVNNVPYNTFLINFLSSNANLSAGANYISNVGAGYSPTFTDRLIPMFENCTARKASISLLNSGPGTNLVGATGYFINTSTNPPQTGIINSAITALVGSNQYTYTGAFATPINVSFGDNVVCAIFSSGATSNVRTSASIYCYN